jgi:hypothetical protein
MRQAFALALGEHDRDGTDMPDEGVKFRAVGADRLELELFGLGEGFWVAEDPSGDRLWRGRPGRMRPCPEGCRSALVGRGMLMIFVCRRRCAGSFAALLLRGRLQRPGRPRKWPGESTGDVSGCVRRCGDADGTRGGACVH